MLKNKYMIILILSLINWVLFFICFYNNRNIMVSSELNFKIMYVFNWIAPISSIVYILLAKQDKDKKMQKSVITLNVIYLMLAWPLLSLIIKVISSF